MSRRPSNRIPINKVFAVHINLYLSLQNQWYCSKSTRFAPSSHSKVRHQGLNFTTIVV
jgi:hypothetical protein